MSDPRTGPAPGLIEVRGMVLATRSAVVISRLKAADADRGLVETAALLAKGEAALAVSRDQLRRVAPKG